MKVCLACSKSFSAAGWQCPSCHFEPDQIAGFPAFAPSLAEANDGFQASHFDELAPLEANNFWFRSRNQLIIWALGRYFPNMKNYLEIGCGTGFVLSGVKQAFPHLHLSGSEIFSNGLSYAKTRVGQCDLFQMDARHIPFEDEFDVIGGFDVLEHITEDEEVLAQLHRAVRPGGGIVLTVPQHAFLWSKADEYACHVRRYSSVELKKKVRKAGFELVKSTSFVSLLLPLMMISRLRQRTDDKDYDPMAELKLSGAMNKMLEQIMRVERALIRLGLPFPAGGSLLLVARKPT